MCKGCSWTLAGSVLCCAACVSVCQFWFLVMAAPGLHIPSLKFAFTVHLFTMAGCIYKLLDVNPCLFRGPIFFNPLPMVSSMKAVYIGVCSSAPYKTINSSMVVFVKFESLKPSPLSVEVYLITSPNDFVVKKWQVWSDQIAWIWNIISYSCGYYFKLVMIDSSAKGAFPSTFPS